MEVIRTNMYLIICSLLLMACSEYTDSEILNETQGEEYLIGDYYIDELGNEGVVAYSSKYSPRFVIVISLDEAYLPWGPMNNSVCQVDSLKANMLTNPAFGLSILQAMQAAGIDTYPAMAWCSRKNGNDGQAGGGAWRLPTQHELSLIFGREVYGGKPSVRDLNLILASVDGTTIEPGQYYWTCNEDYDVHMFEGEMSDDASEYDRENRAVPLNTFNETPADKDLWLKKNFYYVRAIKYLYYSNI